MCLPQICPWIVDMLEYLCRENYVYGAVARIDAPLFVDEPIDPWSASKVNT
jgi:hypothetical protein